MFDHIRADIARYHGRADTKLLRTIWYSSGLKTVVAYRLGRWLRISRRSPLCWPMTLVLTPLYWALNSYTRHAFDIHLHQSAEIGPGLYIGHFGGIRVRDCQLGAHCSIQQETCLEAPEGQLNGPTIGNRVWVGAHARIQSPVYVGDGATIGAGAVITQDVATNCLVLGNPARVVLREYDNNKIL